MTSGKPEVKHFTALTTVLLDLDGTLRHNVPEGTTIFQQYAAERGVAIDPQIRHKAARWMHAYFARSPELKADLESAAGDEALFWRLHARRYLEVLGAPPEKLETLGDEISHLMQTDYQPSDQLAEGAIPTLQQLQADGFRLALFSNRRQPVAELIHELGLIDFFELVIVAGEIGQWKPDPLAFQTVLGRLKIEAHEAIYIGDNYYADVVGAQAAGMHAVLVDPQGLFSDVECPRVSSLSQLPDLLQEQTFVPAEFE
jgi:putative hydrolase of the HAD superfamily